MNYSKQTKFAYCVDFRFFVRVSLVVVFLYVYFSCVYSYAITMPNLWALLYGLHMEIANDKDLELQEKKKKLDNQKKKLLLKEKILRDKEKKKEVLKLQEIGRLAKLANITHLNEQVLFGAFIEIAKKTSDQNQIVLWKKIASDVPQGNQNNENTKIYAISFKEDPSLEIKESLKNMNFKWNKFRKEFYGSANLETLKVLLKSTEQKIDEISL